MQKVALTAMAIAVDSTTLPLDSESLLQGQDLSLPERDSEIMLGMHATRSHNDCISKTTRRGKLDLSRAVPWSQPEMCPRAIHWSAAQRGASGTELRLKCCFFQLATASSRIPNLRTGRNMSAAARRRAGAESNSWVSVASSRKRGSDHRDSSASAGTTLL